MSIDSIFDLTPNALGEIKQWLQPYFKAADDGNSDAGVVVTKTTDDGPTGVTATGNGDALYSFPAGLFAAATYYWELSCNLISAAGDEELFFRLHDTGSPGTLVKEVAVTTPHTNPGAPIFVRVPVTPTAGPHTYTIRWRGGPGSYTLSNSNVAFVSRIVRA